MSDVAEETEEPSLIDETSMKVRIFNDGVDDANDADKDNLEDEELSGIVVWSGSNAAKRLNCRGWFRSDDEWEQRLDSKLRKEMRIWQGVLTTLNFELDFATIGMSVEAHTVR